MALLSPQVQHQLIPQAHSPEQDETLVEKIREFRGGMFGRFQQQIDAAIAPLGAAPQEQQYRTARATLDADAEIQEIHRQRGVWQDRLWQQVLDEIAADRPRLEAAYETHRRGPATLELDPNLELPGHQVKTNIHRMPGGYLGRLADDGLTTGALYDHGTFVYGGGWFGGLSDELGQTVIHNVVQTHYPDLAPTAILDLGCAVGHSTLPYAQAFPEARVHAIDVGSALLEYASARASALGQTVHFSQQNAEGTGFADGSFDLVVSHILFHEIPAVARRRVFAESCRLLKPGGLMVHLESRMFLDPPSLVSRYFRDTEVWVNHEPFLGSSKFADFPGYAEAAGFGPGEFQIHYVPGYYSAKWQKNTAGWAAFCGVRA